MKDIYLTDEQYLKLLDKVKDLVIREDSYFVFDSTTIGDKYTTSNIGLCNEELTDLDTALFPNEFKNYNRKCMKYKKEHHLCPFDNRIKLIETKETTNMLNGCYYTCSLQKKKPSREEALNLIMYTKELARENKIKIFIEK